jgi:hypothetical protein
MTAEQPTPVATVNVQIDIPISKALLDAISDAPRACAYWIADVEQAPAGFNILIDEEGRRHRIDQHEIGLGIKRIFHHDAATTLHLHPNNLAALRASLSGNHEDSLCDFDDEQLDWFIQIACFREVIYG